MNVKLDEIRETAGRSLVWDLAIDGQKVRPLTLNDLEELSAGQKRSSPEVVAAMFEEPKPDTSGWDMEKRDAVFAIVGGYVMSMLEKKRNAIALQVKAMAQGDSTFGRP